MEIRVRFGVPGADMRYRKDVRFVEQGVPLSRSAIWPLAATRRPSPPPPPPVAIRDAWFQVTGREPVVARWGGLAIDLLRFTGDRWVEYLPVTMAPYAASDPPAPQDLDHLQLGFDWVEVSRPRYDDPRFEGLLDRPVPEALLAVPVGAAAALAGLRRALPTLVVIPGPPALLTELPDLAAALAQTPDPRALAMVAHAGGDDVRLGRPGSEVALCVLLGARFDAFPRVAAAVVG